MLIGCLLGSLFDTKDEGSMFSEMSVNFYQAIRRHVLENSTVHGKERVSNITVLSLSNLSNRKKKVKLSL
jgi:hypothetical protein